MIEELNKNVIQAVIGTDKEVRVLDSTVSTNNDMKEWVSQGATDGNLIVADTQTGGRGRLEGRVFYSPSGSGIYMTCLVKPDCPISKAGLITPAVAVAVARAIEKVCGIRVGIKWVNDLYLNGRKICGILCESNFDFENKVVKDVIVGIGVNLFKPGDIPVEIQDIMGWLMDEDKKVRNVLIGEIYNNVNYLLKNMYNTTFMDIYREESILINKKVHFVYNNNIYIGHVINIDDDAQLVVDVDGQTIKLNSGEVSLID